MLTFRSRNGPCDQLIDASLSNPIVRPCGVSVSVPNTFSDYRKLPEA
jgi:hypothetical protein